MDQITPSKGLDSSLADDLLIGAEAIARFIGLSEPQVFQAHRKRFLPTFKYGALICARKSELRERLSAKSGEPIPPARRHGGPHPHHLSKEGRAIRAARAAAAESVDTSQTRIA
jgi:hypothetical protein